MRITLAISIEQLTKFSTHRSRFLLRSLSSAYVFRLTFENFGKSESSDSMKSTYLMRRSLSSGRSFMFSSFLKLPISINPLSEVHRLRSHSQKKVHVTFAVFDDHWNSPESGICYCCGGSIQYKEIHLPF